jgi:hypothetical protein
MIPRYGVRHRPVSPKATMTPEVVTGFEEAPMMRRWIRLLVTLAFGLLVAPLTAMAQPTGKTARIGYLTPVTGRNPVEEAFEQALQALGWSRGQNLTIESRYSGGRQDTIAALVAELVGLRPDVIVAWGPGFGPAACPPTVRRRRTWSAVGRSMSTRFCGAPSPGTSRSSSPPSLPSPLT